MIAAHKLQLNPVSPENLLEPAPLYRELRTQEPVHWSDEVQAWFITRHEDVRACLRDPRLSANRTKLRQAHPELTVQALEAWQPVIRRLMEELVERVRPRGRMELVRELSSQLPPLVIAELLGIPAEERERFVAWAKPLAEVSHHTTTTDQISNGLHALLTHPDQLRKLREEPGLVKSAVEEILRFNPAVPFMHRLAAESFELHGQRIRQGSVVLLGIAAANRDPLVFPEPDRFDITRPGAQLQHLGFGFGPHPCLGAHLARRELETVLEVLLRRLPGLRLDESCPPRRKSPSLDFHGFESLHVRW